LRVLASPRLDLGPLNRPAREGRASCDSGPGAPGLLVAKTVNLVTSQGFFSPRLYNSQAVAIRKIQEVPSELPHARLFLDDVEQIVDLLRDATTRYQTRRYQRTDARTEPPPVTVVYRLGDLELDSVQDLQAHGGGAANFRIQAVTGDWVRVEVALVGWATNPHIRIPFEKDEAWTTYAKVKAVFDSRQLRLKNAVLDLPGWVKALLYVAFVFVAPIGGPLVLYALRLGGAYVVSYWVVLSGILTVFFYVMFRPSQVILIRSRERQQRSWAAKKSFLHDLLIFALGSIAGALVNYFLPRLLNRH
jgi:hypothetical protein